jgi:hypothetical protein
VIISRVGKRRSIAKLAAAPGVGLAMAALSLACGPGDASACIIPDGADDSAYVTNGAAAAGFVLSLQATTTKSLAEGTEVEVEPVPPAPATSWADALKDVIGTAKGLPADSSRNHDPSGTYHGDDAM